MASKMKIVAFLFGVAVTVAHQAVAEDTSLVRHPVLRHDIDPENSDRYKRNARSIMAMDESQMLRLIPVKSGIMFCGCPNCLAGQQENGQFDWTIERPMELTCKFCGHVYPSDTYPLDSTATGVNSLGETVTYRYYFDEKSGRDYWLEAFADRLRRRWFVKQCEGLAACYHVTRDGKYARRAALILDRFAQAYPHMAVLSQWPYRRRAIVKPTPPYPSSGGKWGRWMAEEVPHGLPEAYDLIHDSPELDKLCRESGRDVRRQIEDDFFRAAVEYTFTFGAEPTGRHLNNMAPFYTRNIVHVGRVIGEPRYVHWGHRWVGEILREGFFYDGMWREAPSYHYQTIGGIRQVMTALAGYSDPPGYQPDSGDTRLENVNLEKQVGFMQKALGAASLVSYPNGRICPAHDSWATSRRNAPRQKTMSMILPGFGHASLGRGEGVHQLQAQLHFSGGHGHQHADSLNLALFAKGGEMLSDIGYSHTKLRRWTISTAGHNTVIIDREEQNTTNSDGDLVMFIPDAAGLSALEARGERAYRGLAERYRRQLLLVPVSPTDAYVVDMFWVKGGTVHDWLLHGSADDDMTAECSVPLTDREGTLLESSETWEEPIGESSPINPYGLMCEIREAKTRDTFAVTFLYADTEGPAAGAGVRTHLLGGPTTEVLLGKSPRVRPAEGDDQKVYDYWMPQLVARRRGQAPLGNLFAAVHEPFRPEPFLGSVRALPIDPSDTGTVALEIQHNDVRDTIISTLDEPPYPERRLPEGISIQGRLGMLRESGGQVIGAWMVDGTRLSKGDFVLTNKHARYQGTLTSATRKADGAAGDSLITDSELPAGDALAGRWMIVTHGNGHTRGYEISSVRREKDHSVILLRDDHGLKITDNLTEECYFPRRKISGTNRYVIHTWTAQRP